MKKIVLSFLAGLLLAALFDAFAASAASDAAMRATFDLQQFGFRYLAESNGWKEWNHTLYEQRKQAEAEHSKPNHIVLPFASPLKLEIPKDCSSPTGKWQNAIEVTCPNGLHIVVQGFPAKD